MRPAVYQASFYVGPIIFLLFSCLYTNVYLYDNFYVQCFHNIQSKFVIVFKFVLCYTSITSFVNSFEKYENKLNWIELNWVMKCQRKCLKRKTYTERQKKLITSLERHLLKSKALKWIIIGHRLAIVVLTNHNCKKTTTTTFAWIKKEQNKVNSQEVIFQKSQNLLASPGHGARHGQ